MKDMDQQSVTGKLTVLEVLLIKSIVIYCIFQGIRISPEIIYQVYIKTFELVCNSQSIKFPLYARNSHTIKGVLHTIFKHMDLLFKHFHIK